MQGHPIPKDFDYAAPLPAPEKAGAYRDRVFRNDLVPQGPSLLRIEKREPSPAS